MTQVATREKRRFSRILFDAPVTIRTGDRRHESRLLDISLKGMLVAKTADWPADAGGRVELSVPMVGSEHDIRMQAHKVHEENGHVGYQCDHIDLDSISALKRLVELNVTDAEMLERELGALLDT